MLLNGALRGDMWLKAKCRIRGTSKTIDSHILHRLFPGMNFVFCCMVLALGLLGRETFTEGTCINFPQHFQPLEHDVS